MLKSENGEACFSIILFVTTQSQPQGENRTADLESLCLPFLTQNVKQCATVDKQTDSESANLRFNAVFLTKQLGEVA